MDTRVTGKSEKIFQTIINIVLILLTLAAILPFILLLSSSLTAEEALLVDGYSFFPKNFSVFSYQYLFIANGAKILRSYGTTFLITIVGTGLSLLIGPMLAYPLSRKDYPRAKVLTFVVFFTMLFNGGVVPSYMMWTQIFGIRNTIWALILPNLLFNGFYIILYKNNFSTNIHPALVEAAKIDGADEFYIYFKVVLPLSLPIMATIGLMIGIGYWNDWVNGLYYITDTKLYSLQVLLNSIMNNIKALASLDVAMGSGASSMPSTGIRMAMAVVGVVPIMVLYPFFSKAFVKGIAIGGVKE